MIKIAIIGAGSRGNAYNSYFERNQSAVKVVAVADPQEHLRLKAQKIHKLADESLFLTYDDMFAKGVIADALFIATQDDMHFDPCMKAMEIGYKHILLEKPISPSYEECVILAKKAEELGVNIQVCHVLRYSPFYSKMKEILDSGIIGDIVTINHIEGVGHAHQSHSFVRGDWRNKELSSPMILAKCCHDTDLILYLTGKNCIELSSYGSNFLFRKEMAPEGSTMRCIDDCKVKSTCPYNCFKVYDENEWMRGCAVEKKNYTSIPEAMAENQYGRCVYHCDNNVVDHQVVNFLMEDCVTAHLTMTAYMDGRVTDIGGTMGKIHGEFEKKEIVVTDFRTNNITTYFISANSSGHGGSDYCMMESFMKMVTGEEDGKTNISVSLQSHAMCHAAEKSRLEGRNVKVSEI